MRRDSAQADCWRFSSRHRSKKLMGLRAISTASPAACVMTSVITGRSCSKVVVGSFVNHFGGSPSAASPVSAPRPSETCVVRKNCGRRSGWRYRSGTESASASGARRIRMG